MVAGYSVRAARPDELIALPAIEAAAATLHLRPEVAPVSPRDQRDLAAAISATTPVRELEIARQRGHLLVAADDAGPVGFLILAPLDDDLYLEEVDVHPDHGRRGVGRALVMSALALGRAAAVARMVLSTKHDLAFNAPFYASCGFRALADDELSPRMRTMRAAEAARGLPIERRVFMACAL